MSKKSASIFKTNLLHSHLADKQTIAHYLQLKGKQQWQVPSVDTTKESLKTAKATKWYDTAKADGNHHNCASNNNTRKVSRTTNGNNGDATFCFNINPLWCISTTTTITTTTATTVTTQHQQHHSNSHHHHHYHRHRNKTTLHNNNNHHNQRLANNTQYHNNSHIKCNLHKSKVNLENSQHHHQQQTKSNIYCSNAQKSSILVSEPNYIFQRNDKKVRLKNLKNTKYHNHHHDEVPYLATSVEISQQHENRLSLSPKVCHKMSQHQKQQLLCMFQVVSPLKSKSTAATTTTTKTLHHSIWHLDGSSAGVAPTTPISCLPLNGTKHFNLDYKTVLQCCKCFVFAFIIRFYFYVA